MGIGSRCGGGGSSAISVISRRRDEWRWFTSMMIFFAECSSVGDKPDRGGEEDPAVGRDLGRLDDREVDLAEEPE